MERATRLARDVADMVHALNFHVMNGAVGQTVGRTMIHTMQAAALQYGRQAIHMNDPKDWRWNRDGH